MEITKDNIQDLLKQIAEAPNQASYDTLLMDGLVYIQKAPTYFRIYRTYIKALLANMKYLKPEHLNLFYELRSQKEGHIVSIIVGHKYATEEQIEYFYFNHIKDKKQGLYSKLATRPNTPIVVLEDLYGMKIPEVTTSIIRGEHRSKFMNKADLHYIHPLVNSQLIENHPNKENIEYHWSILKDTLFEYSFDIQRLVMLNLLKHSELSIEILDDIFERYLVKLSISEYTIDKSVYSFQNLYYEIIRNYILHPNQSSKNIMNLTMIAMSGKDIRGDFFLVIKRNFSFLTNLFNAFHLQEIEKMAKERYDYIFVEQIKQHPNYNKIATGLLDIIQND